MGIIARADSRFSAQKRLHILTLQSKRKHHAIQVQRHGLRSWQHRRVTFRRDRCMGLSKKMLQMRLGVQELIRECAYIFVVGTARLREWRQSRYAILRGTSFTHELRPAFKEPAYLPHNFMYRGNQMVRLHQTARCVDAR